MPFRSTTQTARTIRSWIRRFDQYTLVVFNPGAPYLPRTDRA
jgi:hypothetical protein